jgi:hypothetical protein
LGPPIFLLPSGLLSQVFLATLAWFIIITFPNHATFLLYYLKEPE